jgi:hypothetical protein
MDPEILPKQALEDLFNASRLANLPASHHEHLRKCAQILFTKLAQKDQEKEDNKPG